MSRFQAIALDMDGTLLNRDHKISSATRAALAQARAHDIKVLLVTGRHFMTARPFHHELALDTPIICSNGAYLYDSVQEKILVGDPLAVAPLSRLLAEVQAGAEAFCQQQGCALHLEAPEPDLCLLANSSALAGAINNLIANARQAGADSLLVSAVRSGNRVEMRVIDNGKGMAPSLLNQIFEPFFTTRSQGTGLGLAVVQSVVRAHQGEVSVASVPGEGTCFTLSFPLHQQQVQLGGVA